MPALSHAAALGAALALVGCDLAYPEVVVVNRTAARVQLRDVSFSGCSWEAVLGYGESTSVARCLPGVDRVHFAKLDLAAGDLGDDAPRWFNYQTVSLHRVDYGDFVVIEILPEDLEQDFSVPGPYGH